VDFCLVAFEGSPWSKESPSEPKLTPNRAKGKRSRAATLKRAWVRGFWVRFGNRLAAGVVYTGLVSDITRILDRVQRGDPQAAEELLPLVYEELRKRAAQKMAQQPSRPPRWCMRLGLSSPPSEVATANHLADQDAEPDFDLIHPGGVFGGVTKPNPMGGITQKAGAAFLSLEDPFLALDAQEALG
jgi:hypothetical protein